MRTAEPTLLDWVLRQYPDTPRSRAKEWILAGRVSVKGVVIRRPHEVILDPGGALELRSRHATTLECGSGWQIHPSVLLLHLDSALAILNKGPGILSVPGPGGRVSALSILADFLAGNIRPSHREFAGKKLPAAFHHLRPLPVHRLDQYTSGVFCIAMNPTARQHLIQQVKAHSMAREYVAFVQGRPTARRGTWRHLLELSRDETRQRVISKTQKEPARPNLCEAVTLYEVLAEYPLSGGRDYVTKLRLRLETGLKHQIRIQAATAGLPIVGDRTYNRACNLPPATWKVQPNPGPSGPGQPGIRMDFPRQALHAARLTLEHPERPGERMTWAADFPEDMRQLEAKLKRGRLKIPGGS